MIEDPDFKDDETQRLDAEEGGHRRWLTVLGGSVAGGARVIELVRGSTLRIGRAVDCDVVVPDQAVSRVHALIHGGARVEVEDLGSANGVWLGGVRVGPNVRAEVPPGTAISVGRALLVVHAGKAPPVVEPAPAESRESLDPPRGVVRDDAMLRLYETATRVARTRLTVLVLGETGVGKELLAAAIHDRSPRASGPFVKINCAALAPQLLESELFGHERGAFTGADRAKAGLVESAQDGTLFLDEVGEMGLDLQAKMLRVLEDRIVKRVGATTGRSIDVRFVAATNRDLEADAARGTFRRDLYFRLKGMVLEIPPLRARRNEILPLARLFLSEASSDAPKLSRAASDVLLAHDWPGNVRELRQAVEHALALADGPLIEPSHFPRDIQRAAMSAPAGTARAAEPAPQGSSLLRLDLAAIEKQRIVDALEACEGNQTKAAEMLGMPRRTLLTRIEAYGLPRPRKNR